MPVSALTQTALPTEQQTLFNPAQPEAVEDSLFSYRVQTNFPPQALKLRIENSLKSQ